MNNSSQLDLKKLQRQPAAPSKVTRHPLRKHWVTRIVLPGAIVGGFVCLLLVTAGTQFMPRYAVTVMPVMIMESVAVPTGVPLFQAAGWVEPRPHAINVAALAAGVVDELLVVEGQMVDCDEPIARLITKDAGLLVRQSKANLALRQGELARCEAELKAATTRVEQPVHMEVLLADAKGMLAKSRTELARLPYLVEAARSAEAFTRKSWEGKQAAQESLSYRSVQQAENEFVSANATLKELVDREPFLKKEVESLEQKVGAVQTQFKLLIEENRQLEEARAKVNSAIATVDEAKVQVEQAELYLSRMVVASPIRGRILRVLVSRGTRLMGLETSAGQNTSTVAQIYDPSQLQIRADVRLEDVPKIHNGQPVEIRTASATELIRGTVLQSTSIANVQKNTLEVKVALINPPANVCPEMLVTATFLSPELPDATAVQTQVKRILIPKSLIDSSDASSFVWLVDDEQRSMRREIVLSKTSTGELCEVVSGLNPTDKLIVQGRETLTAGVRLKIIGEDQTLGVGQ